VAQRGWERGLGCHISWTWRLSVRQCLHERGALLGGGKSIGGGERGDGKGVPQGLPVSHWVIEGAGAWRARARPLLGCAWARGELGREAGLARVAWAARDALAFPFSIPFLFLFPILCYTLGFYACIHVLPSMYTPLWGPLGVN
jgi:hypothetical protein